jgi:cytochrome c oxidase subunit II
MSNKRAVSVMSAAVLLLALAFSLLGAETQAEGQASEPKVIAISAKRFAFTPDHIVLKKGETVILRLSSEDVTHGLFLRPLKIDETIEPGHPVDVKVTPQTAGEFSAICDHFCGAGHGNMKMSVTVE